MSGQSTSVLARLRKPVELGRRSHHHHLVGGVPQVSLLPGEVREAGAVAAHRRKLVVVVVAAAVVAAGAVAGASNVETTAQARLVESQSQSQAVSAQVAKFDDVRELERRIAVGDAGVKVGSSTLIDWQTQLNSIEAEMPAGYSVTDISANGATPLIAYSQGDTILEPVRAATVTMKIAAGSIGDEFSVWLRKLRSIPAYADATAATSFDNGTGDYIIALTVHLNAKAISAGTWTENR